MTSPTELINTTIEANVTTLPSTWLIPPSLELVSQLSVSDTCVLIGNKGAHSYFGNKESEFQPDLTSTPFCSDLPSGLKIGQWNIRSLNECKHEQLKHLFRDPGREVDILGITETWLECNTSNELVAIKGYNIERRDRPSDPHGGVLMYINEDIPYNHRYDLQHEYVEAIWIEIIFPKSKPYLIATVYRPPNSLIEWYEHFETMTENAYNEGKEMIIMGDFNIDLLKPDSVPTRWSRLIDAYNTTQLIQEPTRIQGDSETLIDHMYVTNPEHVRTSKVPKIDISDHFPTCMIHLHNGALRKNHHTTIKYRSYKQFEDASFLDDLKHAPWNIIETFDNPNDALDAWTYLFMDVVNQHAPIKQRRVKRATQPEWLDDETLAAMKLRDTYAARGDDLNRKIWRNKVTTLIRQAKTTYYRNTINSNLNDSKKLWGLLHELSPKPYNSPPVYINEDGKEITDPKDIADSFNTFFTDISKHYLANTRETSEVFHEQLHTYIREKIPDTESYSIPEIPQSFVEKQLQSLDSHKSMGLDGVPTRLLKMAAPIIAPSMTYIMNLSISTGIFPDIWKTAKVVPIHKSDSKQDRGNYRPISILAVLSKIIERHVHDSLYSFLTKFNLLHIAQSGFRKLFSCETALVYLTTKWAKAIDKNLMNGIVLLDLRKAFDLVNHRELIKKLELYQCTPSTMSWFKSYLTDRNQQTIFKGKLSNPLPVTCGVPQGSILGHLLFILFINDLPLNIENGDIDMYADDSTLSVTAKTTSELNTKSNEDMSKITQWCKNNKMVPNVKKTKSMLITTRQKREHMHDNDKTLNVYLNGEKLECVEKDKLLGVTVSHDLSWNNHIYRVTKILNSKLALLRKIKQYLTLEARQLFYNAHVLPHLDYCSTVWGSCPQVSELLKVQKRAARLLLDIKESEARQNCSVNMFKTLNWQTIRERIEFRKVMMVYKSQNGLAPKYITELFGTKVADVHKQNTRSCSRGDLYLPGGKHKDILTKGSIWSSIKLWNMLPDTVRNAPTLQAFKSAYLRSRPQ